MKCNDKNQEARFLRRLHCRESAAIISEGVEHAWNRWRFQGAHSVFVLKATLESLELLFSAPLVLVTSSAACQ
jgi:hypothetical protein